MCHGKKVAFTFKFCVGNATSLISRHLLYIFSTFKVKVNDMVNVHVKLIKHDKKEQVRQVECVREMLEMRH